MPEGPEIVENDSPEEFEEISKDVNAVDTDADDSEDETLSLEQSAEINSAEQGSIEDTSQPPLAQSQTPDLSNTEFSKEQNNELLTLGNFILKTENIRPVNLSTFSLDISDNRLFSDFLDNNQEQSPRGLETDNGYLPFLISQLTNRELAQSSPLVFEMNSSEPSYAVLSPLTASGTTGNDTINGLTAQNNVIDGLNGDDIINGGNLADQIYGGDGNDIISGNDGDDRIIAAAGNDQVTGGNGDDWIWGGAGADNIDGNTGNDFISGNQGDDILSGMIGSDILYGGEGNDTIFALDTNQNNKSDLTFINLIFGDDGNDIIYGSSGQDTLNGGIGNDLINSGSGAGDNYEDYILGLNPIVYYRLGEIMGLTANDASGNLDANYTAGIQYGEQAFNNSLSNSAVKLNGSDEQVILSADDARFDTTEGTVSAWFNVDNLSGSYAVFSKDGNGNVDGQFYVGVNSSGDIYGRLQQGGSDSNFTFDPTAAIGSKIQAGQWYMLTMTYGSGGADFYVNGQLVGSDALLTQTNSDRGFMIGGQNSTTSARDEFQGSIDEVFWLPDEMNAGQVSALYTAGTSATDNTGLTKGIYVDTSGTGTFTIGNQIAALDDISNTSDELTLLNNANLIV